MGNHLKSIQRVSDSYLCSNCGACKAVCPKDAIEFKSTSIGRMYAFVSDKCIDCGVCQKTCPSLTDFTYIHSSGCLLGSISSVRVGKSLESSIFKQSQSGGACTAILKYLFDLKKIDGALVCRMDYGGPVPEVKSVIIGKADDLYQTQKSCYSPVELLGILKYELHKYKSVAIVGLGCHIEGLMGIEHLNRNIRDKIYCKIGLICDRTLCGTIQDVYSSYVKGLGEIKINWKCKHLSIGDKKFYYKDAPLVIFNNTGKKKIFPNIYRFALKDMFTSPRCRICRDKLNVCSDITLGDPWEMSDIDWENGESLVIGRTDKGEEIIKEAIKKGYIELSPRPQKELVAGQKIDERKKQVLSYANAFSFLQPSIESFLLNTSVNDHEELSIKTARHNLEMFVEDEALPKDKIIKKARKQIKKALFRRTIPFRAARKFYHLLKR